MSNIISLNILYSFNMRNRTAHKPMTQLKQLELKSKNK